MGVFVKLAIATLSACSLFAVCIYPAAATNAHSGISPSPATFKEWSSLIDCAISAEQAATTSLTIDNKVVPADIKDLNTSTICLQKLLEEMQRYNESSTFDLLINGALSEDQSAKTSLSGFRGAVSSNKGASSALSGLIEALSYKREVQEKLATVEANATSSSISISLPPAGKQEIIFLTTEAKAIPTTTSPPSFTVLDSPLPTQIRAVAGSDKAVTKGADTLVTIPVVVNNLGASSGKPASPGDLEMKITEVEPFELLYIDYLTGPLSIGVQVGAVNPSTTYVPPPKALSVNKPDCESVRSDLVGQTKTTALQPTSVQPSKNADVDAITFNDICSSDAQPLSVSESTTGSAPSTTSAATATAAYSCNGQIVTVFDNTNGGAVVNGGTAPSFTTNGPICVTTIETYHWNNGAGAAPGTISLERTGGSTGFPSTAGPFPAAGSPGSNGAANENWTVTLQTSSSPTVIDGTYKCEDSSPSTWSADTTGGPGFCKIYGIPAQKM